jgi:hypothetical protein
VQGDASSVIEEIRNLKNWQSWNLLVKDGQQIQSSDSILTWRYQQGQFNSIHIDTVNEKGVSTTLILNQGRPLISGFSVERRGQSDSTQVVWYIIEELKWYPWEKFYGMMAADVKGPQITVYQLLGKQ